MYITEIEKAVKELSSRHEDLDEALLVRILEASGWEERHIQDAKVIFASYVHQPIATQEVKETGDQKVVLAMEQKEDTPDPVTASYDVTQIQTNATPQKNETLDLMIENKEETHREENPSQMTYVRSDGIEEGDLTYAAEQQQKEVEKAAQDENLKQKINQEEGVTTPSNLDDFSLINNQSQVDVPLSSRLSVQEKTEPTSLIEEKRVTFKKRKEEIPEDLPLVPFESAPHVWSFRRYRDTFFPHDHQEEETKELFEKEDVQPVVYQQSPTVPHTLPPSPQKNSNPENEVEVEIDFEKTPISKGDESLVALAGVMLVAILLILGYMYSKGRL